MTEEWAVVGKEGGIVLNVCYLIEGAQSLSGSLERACQRMRSTGSQRAGREHSRTGSANGKGY